MARSALPCSISAPGGQSSGMCPLSLSALLALGGWDRPTPLHHQHSWVHFGPLGKATCWSNNGIWSKSRAPNKAWDGILGRS